MKKILFLVAFISGVFASTFASTPDNQINNKTNVIELSDDMPVTVTVLSVSSTAVELLVKANDAVYEACEYFNGSWADVGLTLYCKFNPGSVYVCTAYKITKLACGISGAVKLSLEGDFNNAAKKALLAAGSIWVMSKKGNLSYDLVRTVRNMCPADEE